MQRRVGVLLRLDDPEHEVGERDDPLGLDPVRGLHGVEVGQVEEDEASEVVCVDLVPASDPEPVEQRAGVPAPHRRLAGSGGRPPPPDGGKLRAGQGVEEL